MAELQHKLKRAETVSFETPLKDGRATTIHLTKHIRGQCAPRIVKFNRGTNLLAWCRRNGVGEAIVGGFFLREQKQLLGELWQAGEQQRTVPITDPWHSVRGCLHIDLNGSLELAHRHNLPKQPGGDLLQAGPLLVENGQNLICNTDPEGFYTARHQFDTEISCDRYPRAAIGISKQHILCVAADGYSRRNAGLTFAELADIMIGLGATSALNLDGGSSATLISGGELLNNPRSRARPYPFGRAIHTALVF